MKEIELTKGKVALVDDVDFDWLNKYRWYYSGHGYAYHRWPDGKMRSMHSLIMGKKNGWMVDHKNRNGLDNQRSNLRFVTKSQNAMNSKRNKQGESSKYMGVSWFKPIKKWRAYITFQKNTIALGYFDSEQEAASIRDQAAQQLFGEYAKLNSLDGVYN